MFEWLSIELAEEVKETVKRSKKEIKGFNPTGFELILNEEQYNIVNVARRVIRKNAITSGMEKLSIEKRLDLSLENIIIKEKYYPLFAGENFEIVKNAATCLFNYKFLSKEDYLSIKNYDNSINNLPNKIIISKNREKQIQNIKENIKEEIFEGNTKERTILQKERNQKIVKMVKERDKYTCLACDFVYENKIVEAHHLVPMSDKNEEYEVNIDDLITLCPTCHSLAHMLLEKDEKYMNKEHLLFELKRILNLA